MKSRENITIRFWDISSIYRSLEKPYISLNGEINRFSICISSEIIAIWARA